MPTPARPACRPGDHPADIHAFVRPGENPSTARSRARGHWDKALTGSIPALRALLEDAERNAREEALREFMDG